MPKVLVLLLGHLSTRVLAVTIFSPIYQHLWFPHSHLASATRTWRRFAMSHAQLTTRIAFLVLRGIAWPSPRSLLQIGDEKYSSMMRLQKNAGRWRPRSFLTAAPKSLITDAVSNLDGSHNRSLWWLTGRSSLVRGLVTAAAAVDGCRRCDEAWLHSRNNNTTECSPTLWRYRPQICYQAMLLTAVCFSAAPEQVRNW